MEYISKQVLKNEIFKIEKVYINLLTTDGFDIQFVQVKSLMTENRPNNRWVIFLVHPQSVLVDATSTLSAS